MDVLVFALSFSSFVAVLVVFFFFCVCVRLFSVHPCSVFVMTMWLLNPYYNSIRLHVLVSRRIARTRRCASDIRW